jgi:hypothetical protein
LKRESFVDDREVLFEKGKEAKKDRKEREV